MVYLKENLRFLRKKQGMTQDRLAEMLDSKRSLIGSYEEGRAVPKLSVIRRLAEVFHVSIDTLLSVDLEKQGAVAARENTGLKILGITVTPDHDERITLVPVRASAGYLTGRSDQEYLGGLPHFSMPVAELSQSRTYRVFQIRGDSMLPVPTGSYIFCQYVEAAADILEGRAYVLITADEGIVYKRIYLQNDHEWLLKSDNPYYAPYRVDVSLVLEIWQALGYLSFEMPAPGAMQVQQLSSSVVKLQEEIQKLKGEILG